MFDALFSAFSRKSAEDRALILIREYFEAAEQGTLSGELTGSFTAWFDDPRERVAKDRAMDRLLGALDAKLQGFETSRQTL